MIKYHLYGYGGIDEIFYCSSNEEAVKKVKSKNWIFRYENEVVYGWYILVKEN